VIVLDATPLRSGHAVRGIGRYVSGLVQALAVEQAEYAAANVTILAIDGQEIPVPGMRVLRTRRAQWRSQDIGWLDALVGDRAASRGMRGARWHRTDPWLFVSPVPASRTLVTAYDLIPLQDAEVWATIRPHRRLMYRRYLESLRRARGVITISRTSAENLTANIGIAPARIRVVLPAVESHAPSPGPRDTEATLVYVGVLEPHKRPELAVQTLAALRQRGRDATLVVVGPSPVKRIDALREVAGSLGVIDAVRFMGRVSDEELRDLYQRGVTLALSRLEGFGLPPVEAVLAGGTAVAVGEPIYREVLEDAAVFARSAAPADIADAVEVALEQRIPDEARTRLARRVSPAETAASLRAAYEDLMG
jgi:glycosyltransferase involved in cell wall biosynthesis